MRYLKIFDNKVDRDAAITAGEVSVNSVTIWGITSNSDGVIEFGRGNAPHALNLGFNSDSEEPSNSDPGED